VARAENNERLKAEVEASGNTEVPQASDPSRLLAAESERPTIIAVAVDPRVSPPIEERAVPSDRVLSVATGDGLAMQLPHDVEESGRSCALSGRVLEAGSLCDIVSFIAQAVWRGELVVRDDLTTRSLFFDQGHLIAAESSASAERLGEVLCRRKILTREQVSACAEITMAGASRFGEAAVELGFATREVVFEWLALQIEEIFFAVLRVEQGVFAFFHGYEEARLSFRRKHEIDALLERAIRGMDDPRWFRSRIPSAAHVPVRASGRTEPAHDPLGLYGAIDGSKTVAELAEALGSSELDVTRALFQYVQTGHATVKPPCLGTLEIVDIYNKAILVLLRELDAMDEGDAVRSELAKFAERGNDRPDFVDAPADDGTLDAGAIASRLCEIDDPMLAAERLARWLYDYASYALFLGRPHLQRRDEGGDNHPRVSQRVAEILEPIAPTGDLTLPPIGKPPRVTIPAPLARAGSSAFANHSGPPRISSTVRMRRVLVGAIPGLDPSRTVRIAPFSVPAAEPPISVATPSRSAEPAPAAPLAAAGSGDSSRRVVEPTAPPDATRRNERASSVNRSRSISIVVVLALLGGGAAGWAAHWLARGADRPVELPASGATSSPAPAPAPPDNSAVTAPAPGTNTEIVVVCEPKCGAVYLDGKLLAASDEAIAVTAGAHDVAVRRAGYTSDYRHVVVAEGESRAVAFQLAPVGRSGTK
jgi:hypothetical protein